MTTKQDAPDNGAPMVKDDGVLDLDENAEDVPANFNITSYGADFDVSGLIRRLEHGDVVIPTFEPNVEGASGVGGFQRDFVWNRRQMDRFIESLLFGLPVPGIFLVSEPDGRFLVLDGSQRLRTLRHFYKGTFGSSVYRLGDHAGPFAGKSYEELDPEDRRRLDNSIIHATVIREDDPAERFSSVYTIFERLNTGGTTLRPQEIRVALYHGDFVQLISDLNTHPSWRRLYGLRSKTLKDQELILRFLAFYHRLESYSAPMKDFLNTFMADFKDLPGDSNVAFTKAFETTVTALDEALGGKAFRIGRQLNAAVLDSVMVATAKSSKERPLQPQALADAYHALLQNDAYLDAVQRTTANEERVRLRFQLADEGIGSAR